MITKKYYLITFLFLLSVNSFAQTAYFIDGFHGGIWGHYPLGYTSFIVNQLKQHPGWNINLEIEPETWDRVEVKDPQAYKEFKSLFADQSSSGRIEYVNPAFAQSYLFNIEGESIIRQFSYGIKKLKEHFPSAVFTTYSSEEPCFTSALPQILTSFGFKYASLKNPNTCWGGYTRAFGDELVNWVGPDGTKITTVPRYQIESLKPGSTWETIGNGTSKEYIQDAFNYGIQHPVGMCLQDAGWRYGPWLRSDFYSDTQYTTWRNYFENIANKKASQDWKFSQEDVQVSLVWGSQVLQTLAQEVRTSENKIIQAEKMAAVAAVYKGTAYPANEFDKAWRTLLLSQHHDCWIVPYNGKLGNTWADKVSRWTDSTNAESRDVIVNSVKAFSTKNVNGTDHFVRVFNTTAVERNEWVNVNLPAGWNTAETRVLDKDMKPVLSQNVLNSESGKSELLFKASVPPLGYQTYQLQKGKSPEFKGASVEILPDGTYKAESDLYSIVLDPSEGGIIKHLIAKKLHHKDFVKQLGHRKFNELRGNFYNKGGFHSSTDNPAKISVLENGPARVRLKIEGTIAGSPFTQILSLAQGQRRIDLHLKIDWQGNPGIGEFDETNYQSTALHKAFYNDRYKLLTLFPLSLQGQKVYKNAPFDVTESKLNNTFFSTWDSIKNNIMLNWVDIADAEDHYGCALFTDHTTSYTHGSDFPLGLTIQYSGKGLWGRNYSITHPTEINYALVPHEGKWDKAGIWTGSASWNEPLLTFLIPGGEINSESHRSLIREIKKGWEISSCHFEGNNLCLRIFNAEGDDQPGTIALNCSSENAALVELNGNLKRKLQLSNQGKSVVSFSLTIPRFGIRTVRISNVKAL